MRARNNLRENLLKAQRNIGKRVYDSKNLPDNLGYYTEIYYPVEANSEHSDYGSYGKYIYRKFPNKKGNYIFRNIITPESYSSDLSLDPFFDEMPMLLTTEIDDIPKNSLLKIFLGKRKYLTFKTGSRKIVNGDDGKIIVYHPLLPLINERG